MVAITKSMPVITVLVHQAHLFPLKRKNPQIKYKEPKINNIIPTKNIAIKSPPPPLNTPINPHVPSIAPIIINNQATIFVFIGIDICFLSSSIFSYYTTTKSPRKTLGLNFRGLPNDFRTLNWVESYEEPEIALGKVKELLQIT